MHWLAYCMAEADIQFWSKTLTLNGHILAIKFPSSTQAAWRYKKVKKVSLYSRGSLDLWVWGDNCRKRVETASPCIGPRQQDLRTVCKINKVCQATKHRNAFIFLGLSRFIEFQLILCWTIIPLCGLPYSKNKSRSLFFSSPDLNESERKPRTILEFTEIELQELQGKSRLCWITDPRLLLSTKEYTCSIGWKTTEFLEMRNK